MNSLVLVLALVGQFDVFGDAKPDFDIFGQTLESSHVEESELFGDDAHRVVVYWNCKPCVEQIRREVSGSEFNFEFRDEGKIPEIGKKYPLPVIHFRSGEGWRINGGWTGLDDFRKLWEKWNPDSKGSGQGVSAKNKQSGYYPVHAQQYNVNGDWNPSRATLIHHLLFGGEHAGKFSRDYLESLSRAELLSLHDDDHTHRVQTVVPVVAKSSVKSTTVGRRSGYFANCPTCPR